MHRAATESLESRAYLTVAFNNAVNYGVGSAPDFVAAADLNGDGRRDLVSSSYAGQHLKVLLGNANGTFQAATTISLAWKADFVTMADVNADGKIDLLTANYDTGTAGVLLGNGNGTFGAAATFSTGPGPRALIAGDFTGDGQLDLVISKSFENKLTLLTGNGNGTFQTPVHLSTTNAPTDVAAADVDGDGDLDVIAANYFADRITVYRNNGSGSFTAGNTYTTGTGPTSVYTADLNADGKVDVVTANIGSNNVSVLLGNGNATFVAAVNYAVAGGPTFVSGGDVNGDGKPDLVVAAADTARVAVLEANGDGTFVGATTFTVQSSPRSLVVADFNGNGVADVAVANQGTTTLSVLLSASGVAVPVAVPGGPYSASEGGSVQLNGSGSTGNGLTYAWDLDGDGVYGETGSGATRGNETGATPTFSAAGLDGPSSRNVSLRVTDSLGRTSTASATINITNVSPTITISGSSTGDVGIPYTLTFGASGDTGSDTITSWQINWGDGTIETITGNPGSATHTYLVGATRYTITATATDEDGTYTSNAVGVTVAGQDVSAPTATADGDTVVAPGSNTYQFTVNYDDNVALDPSTLGDDDIVVTGPNGFFALAEFISVVDLGGGRYSAVYEISVPGGAWDQLDNGTYSITLTAASVADTAGNTVAGGVIGDFLVLLPATDTAGNDISSARSLGNLGPDMVKVVEEFVGSVDRNDYYRFTISQTSDVDLRIMNLLANADVQLLDANGVRISLGNQSGTNSETILRSLHAGTYYIRVLYTGPGGTSYRMRLGIAAAQPNPGDDNSTATARDLGTIRYGTVRSVSDMVGSSDRNDFFKVTIDEPTKLYVKLYELSENADLQVFDSAGNRIGYSKKPGTAADSVTLDLAPGTYFIRVLYTGAGSTPYRLRVAGI